MILNLSPLVWPTLTCYNSSKYFRYVSKHYSTY